MYVLSKDSLPVIDYITAPPRKKNVQAVSGAVAQRHACMNAMQRAVHPLSVVQQIYRSAISIETGVEGRVYPWYARCCLDCA